jgi:hypothetical protein
LVARKVAQNYVIDECSRLPTLSKAVDEQDVECGIEFTQPSQETQANNDAEEPPSIASNETVLNMKPVCRSFGAGDAAVDTGFILGVHPQPIATGFAQDVEPSFIEPEFRPEYEAAFGNERAKYSADD